MNSIIPSFHFITKASKYVLRIYHSSFSIGSNKRYMPDKEANHGNELKRKLIFKISSNQNTAKSKTNISEDNNIKHSKKSLCETKLIKNRKSALKCWRKKKALIKKMQQQINNIKIELEQYKAKSDYYDDFTRELKIDENRTTSYISRISSENEYLKNKIDALKRTYIIVRSNNINIL